MSYRECAKTKFKQLKTKKLTRKQNNKIYKAYIFDLYAAGVIPVIDLNTLEK